MVRINPVKPLGRVKDNPQLLLHEDMMPTYGDDTCTAANGSRDWSCVGGTLNITPEGSAYPCHWLSQDDFFLGNAGRESVYTICRRLYNLRYTLLNRRGFS